MLPYGEMLKQPARVLRTNQTEAEQLLWSKLRRKQLGPSFYLQKPLGMFIVDFYCHAAQLVVEIDGGQHFTQEGRSRDAARDQWLSAHGLTVLRFANSEIFENLAGVLETIYKAVNPP